MSREPNGAVELVRRFVQAVNDGEDDVSEFCRPDFVLSESKTLPGAATVSGLEALRSYGLGWQRNWSEWDWREEEIEEVAPGKVLMVATLWLRGLRSGISVERRWAYVFTVRDGKLARQDGYDTRDQALDAAGLPRQR
jgi:ketosteroid isomerase-like protein